LRGRTPAGGGGEKHAPAFFFQVIHPEAVSGGAFAGGRTQQQNVQAVLRDILGHGNEGAMLPGQPEAEAAATSARHGGLLFTRAEMEAFAEIARECGERPWALEQFKTVTV
jgi:LDH2 family malate/lactate/ureidoglycolate dehydrogenase